MAELDETKLYRLDEVAEITELSARNLRDWAWMGRIEAQKVGREWRMNANQIRLLIGEGTRAKDVMQNIDLTGIESRITDLIQGITGKTLEDSQRAELLSILQDYMRIALTGKQEGQA